MGSISSLRNTQFQPEGIFAFELSSGIKYNQQGAQLLWSPSNHELRAGVQSINYNLDNEILEPLDDSNTKPAEAEKDNGREVSFYINDQYDISDKLSVDYGLRYSIYQQVGPHTANIYGSEETISIENVIETERVDGGIVQGYSGLEPRVSLRYNLSDQTALKASYNRARQYLQLLSNTATPTPVDIWQVSTRYINPLTADNFSVGLAQSFDGLDYSFDVYYKRLDNTLDHRDFAKLILNTNLETETLRGKGRSYGAELSIIKKGEILSGRR